VYECDAGVAVGKLFFFGLIATGAVGFVVGGSVEDRQQVLGPVVYGEYKESRVAVIAFLVICLDTVPAEHMRAATLTR
jgi:hypothetical protein